MYRQSWMDLARIWHRNTVKIFAQWQTSSMAHIFGSNLDVQSISDVTEHLTNLKTSTHNIICIVINEGWAKIRIIRFGEYWREGKKIRSIIIGECTCISIETIYSLHHKRKLISCACFPYPALFLWRRSFKEVWIVQEKWTFSGKTA